MESQRPFLYLTLAFILFFIWSTWQQEQAAKNAPQEVVTTETTNASIPSTNTAATSSSNVDEDVPDISTQQTSQNVADAISQPAASSSNESTVHVKTDVLDLLISTKGGSVIQADLPAYPVSLEEKDNPTRILNKSEKGYSAQSGLLHSDVEGTEKSKLAPDHNAIFTAAKSEYQLEGDSLTVPLTWTNGAGITVTKKYTFTKGSYAVTVEEDVSNQSTQPWTGKSYQLLSQKNISSAAGSMLGIQAYVGAAYFNSEKQGYTKYDIGDMEDEPFKLRENKQVQGGWIAMLEHYFISAWVPNAEQQNEYYSKLYYYNASNDVRSYRIGVSSPIKKVNSGETASFSSILYVGPKDQDSLSQISKGLDSTVDYGFLAFISKPLFSLLQFFHGIVGNWGWAIILVTLALKILFFYPSALSYKSMARMKKLSPQLKSMGERYKNDPQGKQKAMMALYKKEKVNPLGGCLPMLIQIPVFMGLYWVLMESVEIRQAPWMFWFDDLSVMDPYFVLPILMGASMYFQQKLNPSQMDPMQQKIFQWLPVVFTVMFLWFPAGLVLYWLVNNLLSIAQQWYINKKIIGTA